MAEFAFDSAGVLLLCQSCGAEAGRLLCPMDGPPPEQPDPNLVTVRCYACAAVEEAEAALVEQGGNDARHA